MIIEISQGDNSPVDLLLAQLADLKAQIAALRKEARTLKADNEKATKERKRLHGLRLAAQKKLKAIADAIVSLGGQAHDIVDAAKRKAKKLIDDAWKEIDLRVKQVAANEVSLQAAKRDLQVREEALQAREAAFLHRCEELKKIRMGEAEQLANNCIEKARREANALYEKWRKITAPNGEFIELLYQFAEDLAKESAQYQKSFGAPNRSWLATREVILHRLNIERSREPTAKSVLSNN